jgi:hypothetical protein
MVCFSIQIFIPQQQRESNNAVIHQKVKQICKYMNAEIMKEEQQSTLKFYEIRACDNDTVGLLRDLPTPFAVGRIDFLHFNTNLYLHRKHHAPPRIPLLKDIYWLAKSTERWKLPIWNVPLETR